MFRPVTVYEIVCDARDCGTVYEYLDYEVDERFELRVETPDLATWQRSLSEDGWHVGVDVLCPPCAAGHADAVLERMAVDLSQDALWSDGDLCVVDREPQPERFRGRLVDTVPISIDDWQD